jgi:predicted AAA+ superfamily ATPase
MEDIKRVIPGNLADILDYFKIIGILGPRQVGKKISQIKHALSF